MYQAARANVTAAWTLIITDGEIGEMSRKREASLDYAAEAAQSNHKQAPWLQQCAPNWFCFKSCMPNFRDSEHCLVASVIFNKLSKQHQHRYMAMFRAFYRCLNSPRIHIQTASQLHCRIIKTQAPSSCSSLKCTHILHFLKAPTCSASQDLRSLVINMVFLSMKARMI